MTQKNPRSPNIEKLHKQADDLRNSGQVEKAVEAYEELAKILHERGDLDGEANAYHMAGVSCKEAVLEKDDEHFRRAFSYYKQAKELTLGVGNRERAGAIVRDIAITLAYAKDYKGALDLFSESIAILETTSSPSALGITYDKRGLAKMAMSDFKGAEADVRKGLDEIRKEGHWFFEATTLLDLARLMVKTERFDEGIKLANESLVLFEKRKETDPHPRRLAQIHGTLYQAYLGKGDEEKAKIHKAQYEEFLKSLEPQAVPIVREDVESLCS